MTVGSNVINLPEAKAALPSLTIKIHMPHCLDREGMNYHAELLTRTSKKTVLTCFHQTQRPTAPLHGLKNLVVYTSRPRLSNFLDSSPLQKLDREHD